MEQFNCHRQQLLVVVVLNLNARDEVHRICPVRPSLVKSSYYCGCEVLFLYGFTAFLLSGEL
ncbi:hypothetical protein CUMW_265700 [Citrus unshiu]|uniref:Uncharacterized protein n=1 Tax=Citrus unshiu TaxID=55188 RepID=A0A2H5QVJ5_CITUN|nr:hypothetical protein CUMW_265700 [Citrus unshiu]